MRRTTRLLVLPMAAMGALLFWFLSRHHPADIPGVALVEPRATERTNATDLDRSSDPVLPSMTANTLPADEQGEAARGLAADKGAALERGVMDASGSQPLPLASRDPQFLHNISERQRELRAVLPILLGLETPHSDEISLAGATSMVSMLSVQITMDAEGLSELIDPTEETVPLPPSGDGLTVMQSVGAFYGVKEGDYPEFDIVQKLDYDKVERSELPISAVLARARRALRYQP